MQYIMPSASLYELYGGVLARGSRDSLTFVELPSNIRQTEVDSIRHSFEFPVGDFTMDPSQNLLVLVEKRQRRTPLALNPPFRVHIRTLSTNSPHPLAKDPIFEQSIAPYVEADYSFNISILGESVGVLFSGSHQRASTPSLFVVWDWTTGFIRSTMKFTYLDAPDTFSFLSPDAFVLPHFPRSYLIMEEEDMSHGTPLLAVYTMHANGDESHPLYPRPIQVATFLLPPMHAHAQVPRFKCRSDPAPVYVPRYPARSQKQSSSVEASASSASGSAQPQDGNGGRGDRVQRPFYVAPENRIICFSMPLQVGYPVLFTHASTLLSYKKFLSKSPSSAPSEMDANPPPSTIPPSMFDPPNTPSNVFDPNPAPPDLNPTTNNPIPANSEINSSTDANINSNPPTQAELLRIPWATWGPPNTRWLEGSLNFGSYECYVYGTRLVHGVDPEEGLTVPRYRSVRVLDFNAVGVRRAHKEKTEKRGKTENRRNRSANRRWGSEEMDIDDDEVAEHNTHAGEVDDGDIEIDIEHSDGESDEDDEDVWEDGDEAGAGDDDDSDSTGEFDAEDAALVAYSDSDPDAQPRAKCHTVTETSVIQRGHLFLADVHSSLPYREITKRVPRASYNFMIDDERIICLTNDRQVWVYTM
ncbi:hypothetical protein BOTBODRAFT_529644 [Botryobasidium botryosum FD-172 SS1]|uniref:F-box domain-containing protein n=1 Tax=Botryobasidium botryosum (strain FD-172 SS1) TaxID=930990 RepID=A0A067M1F8_BOTB1|nr:hypothetical protein BOTBODRAFT_529644 [Botryobasidium botryosum FD-172 SS1]